MRLEYGLEINEVKAEITARDRFAREVQTMRIAVEQKERDRTEFAEAGTVHRPLTPPGDFRSVEQPETSAMTPPAEAPSILARAFKKINIFAGSDERPLAAAEAINPSDSSARGSSSTTPWLRVPSTSDAA